jgi:hypothetical protein
MKTQPGGRVIVVTAELTLQNTLSVAPLLAAREHKISANATARAWSRLSARRSMSNPPERACRTRRGIRPGKSSSLEIPIGEWA